jgi:RND superfamily putative drug exporter
MKRLSVRKLARWSVEHRRLVLASWLIAAVVAIGLNAATGTGYSNSFTLKGTESSRAIALVKSAAPKAAGDSDQIVIAAKTGKVTESAARADVGRMLAKVEQLPHVGAVTSPYSARGAGQISRDGTIAYATVVFDEQANSIPVKAVDRVIRVAQSADSSDVEIQINGQAIENANRPGPGGLGIGILAAAAVLIFVFGSLLAAVLPLLTAGFALITGYELMGVLSNVVSMPSFSSQLALLIGLGVGVDYALFLVTRYRQAVMRGKPVQEAVIEAVDTSGRAVLFAGMTVCIALLGMLLLNLGFLSGVGIAAAIVVAFTVLSALTLLPALLGFFGTKVLSRSARRNLTAGELTLNDESPVWARWANTLRQRPALFATGAAAVMVIIAIPVLSIRLGSTDAGSDASNTTTRKAYDLLAEGFGPGFNGPLQLVAKVNRPGQQAQFTQVVTAVRHTRDVVSVGPTRVIGGTVASVNVFERGSPQAESTSTLISTLRDTVIPRAAAGRVQVLVGGQTAIFQDFSSVLSGKLPLFIGVVVLLSFLLLMAVFRSLVIPLMAAVMNLLSVAAAFGVVTAVFQWGWLASLIGVDSTGPIAAFLPVIVFAILFGLSMDYEVFLMSRIYEEWQHRKNNTEAIVHGLAATGRTITAAASIMVLVFAAFVLGGQLTIKLFGVGLAAAVFLDALIVRSVLIPSLMLVVGKANWQLPGVLDRALPHLNVEGQGHDSEPETTSGPDLPAQAQPAPAG